MTAPLLLAGMQGSAAAAERRPLLDCPFSDDARRRRWVMGYLRVAVTCVAQEIRRSARFHVQHDRRSCPWLAVELDALVLARSYPDATSPVIGAILRRPAQAVRVKASRLALNPRKRAA